MSNISELSRSEFKVAAEVTRGLSEKEIADRLCVSYKTIRTHTYNIRKKLSANCAVDIARTFLLSLEDPKKFVVALLFLCLQGNMVFSQPDIDLRRPGRTNRIVRTSRKI